MRLLAALALLLAAPVQAQMLPSGTWTGTLVAADGERQPVAAEIERCTGGFELSLDIGGRTARVPASDPATWSRGRLRFTTSRVRMPGTLLPRRLTCSLRADDRGDLGGTCQVGSDTHRLTLAPPPDASFGCDE